MRVIAAACNSGSSKVGCPACDANAISVATAERYWTYARVWLYAELNDAGEVQQG